MWGIVYAIWYRKIIVCLFVCIFPDLVMPNVHPPSFDSYLLPSNQRLSHAFSKACKAIWSDLFLTATQAALWLWYHWDSDVKFPDNKTKGFVVPFTFLDIFQKRHVLICSILLIPQQWTSDSFQNVHAFQPFVGIVLWTINTSWFL